MSSIAYNIDDFEGVFSQVADYENTNNQIYRDVLFAQFGLESANGTSKLFTEYNNMFGMKPARLREQLYTDTVTFTTADGQETFAVFPSASYSLQDRINRDVQFGIDPPTTPMELALYMAKIVGSGYATDPNYYDKWWDRLIMLNPAYAAYRTVKSATGKVSGFLAGMGTGVMWLGILIAGYFLFWKTGIAKALLKNIPFLKRFF